MEHPVITRNSDLEVARGCGAEDFVEGGYKGAWGAVSGLERGMRDLRTGT